MLVYVSLGLLGLFLLSFVVVLIDDMMLGKKRSEKCINEMFLNVLKGGKKNGKNSRN